MGGWCYHGSGCDRRGWQATFPYPGRQDTLGGRKHNPMLPIVGSNQVRDLLLHISCWFPSVSIRVAFPLDPVGDRSFLSFAHVGVGCNGINFKGGDAIQPIQGLWQGPSTFHKVRVVVAAQEGHMEDRVDSGRGR